MLPEVDRCEPIPRPAVRTAVPRLEPLHVRRLRLASIGFGVAVLGLTWLLGELLLHDLSQRFISNTISQVQEEAEGFVQATSDEKFLGEGDQRPGIRSGADSAIDPDVLLGPLAPRILDREGREVDAMRAGTTPPDEGETSSTLKGPNTSEVVRAPALRRGTLVPGQLVTSGQEWQWKVNGELIGRQVVHAIDIRSEKGFQHIEFQKVEGRYVSEKIMRDPRTTVEKIPIVRPPSSRQVLIEWPTTIGGEPVQLQAAVDGDYIDRGVRELRRRIVPKLVAGGAALVLFLGLGYAYVLHLVADARRLEAEAAEQDMLAQVGMLAAGLAHEIRNPLNAVNMNLQLLEEDLSDVTRGPALAAHAGQGSKEPEPVALLHRTQCEIGRLSALVTDFLSYARPTMPQRSAVVLDAVVRECIDLFRPLAEGSGVEITADLQSGAEAVLLDEGMMRQAVMNVLLNAIQAAPNPGGRVSVLTRRIGRSFQLEIADNGTGLPAVPEQIFQAFHSTKKGGTGLGLSISRALVERHCGTLHARGIPGGGARFTISLPVEAA